MTTTIRIARSERGEPKAAPGFAGALGATNAANEILEEIEVSFDADDTLGVDAIADAYNRAFNTLPSAFFDEPAPQDGATVNLHITPTTQIVSDEDQVKVEIDDDEVAWSDLQERAAYYFTEGTVRRLGIYGREALEDRDSVFHDGDVHSIRLAAPAPTQRGADS